MRHQAPALRALQEDVGGNDPRRLRALGGGDVDALEQVVHDAAGTLDALQFLEVHRDRAIGEHRLEGGADRAMPYHARPARMPSSQLADLIFQIK